MICKWMGGWTRKQLYWQTPATWVERMAELMSEEGGDTSEKDEPQSLKALLAEMG